MMDVHAWQKYGGTHIMFVSPHIVAAAVFPVRLSASALNISASSSAMQKGVISEGDAGRKCCGCRCGTRTCASRASCRSRAHSSLLSSSSTSGFALPRGGICVGIWCQAVQSFSWHTQCSEVTRSHSATALSRHIDTSRASLEHLRSSFYAKHVTCFE